MGTLNAAGERLMTGRERAGARYAACLCPDPRSAAGVAAAEWLGRCAARDAAVRQPFVPGVSASLFAALTEEPRSRGFHAALRAPFQAAAGISRRAILEEIESIAKSHAAFLLPPLAVRMHGECLALAAGQADGEADTLAAECVMRLDAYRASPGPDEMRERIALGLSARQHGLLLRWGDPYVMDEYRLHFPLTGQVTMFGEEVAERLAAQAAEHFAGVLEDLRRVDHIALFEQTAPGLGYRIAFTARLASPALFPRALRRGRASLPRN
jgi:hypothetical protein